MARRPWAVPLVLAANLVAAGIAAAALVAGTADGRAPAAGGALVLGSRSFVMNGVGFGTAKPALIFNGGDPSGKVWKISWSSWGGPVALGHGLNWIFRPQGGYYATPVRIELRAEGIGRCSAAGPRAYLHLSAREPARPGGADGPWFTWAGARTLCHDG